VSDNVDLRTLKVKYPANPTAQPYGKPYGATLR